MGWGGLWALGFPDGPLSGSLGGGRRPSRSPCPLQGVWGAVTRDASACALVLTAEVYIGIGKPAERGDVIGFVLGSPAPAEKKLIEDTLDEALECIDLIFRQNLSRATSRLNGFKAAK